MTPIIFYNQGFKSWQGWVRWGAFWPSCPIMIKWDRDSGTPRPIHAEREEAREKREREEK